MRPWRLTRGYAKKSAADDEADAGRIWLAVAVVPGGIYLYSMELAATNAMLKGPAIVIKTSTPKKEKSNDNNFKTQLSSAAR